MSEKSLQSFVEAALADYVPPKLSAEAAEAVVAALVAERGLSIGWLVDAVLEAGTEGGGEESDEADEGAQDPEPTSKPEPPAATEKKATAAEYARMNRLAQKLLDGAVDSDRVEQRMVELRGFARRQEEAGHSPGKKVRAALDMPMAGVEAEAAPVELAPEPAEPIASPPPVVIAPPKPPPPPAPPRQAMVDVAELSHDEP